MPVNLSKGSKVSLAKAASDAGIAGLTRVVFGLGWDTNRYDGGDKFDLDVSAFMLGANGKVRTDADFIFYNKRSDVGEWKTQGAKEEWIPDEANSSVYHSGDNRTGAGDGDDETVTIDLTKIPVDVDKIAFTVTIDEAEKRHQNFGMVENSYIRAVDETSDAEIIRYDLGEDYSIETAVVVGELYRHDGEWKFNAIGSGFQGGLGALCANYGIQVE